MRIADFSLLIFYSLVLHCNALTCRTDFNTKQREVKKTYIVCMKQLGNSNNSSSRVDMSRNWKAERRNDQWSQINMARNRWDVSGNTRMGEMQKDSEEMIGSQNKQRGQGSHIYMRGNRPEMWERDGNDGKENKGLYARDGNGDKRPQINRGVSGRNDYVPNADRPNNNRGVSGKNDFVQNEDFSGHSNQYPTQPTRTRIRYAREREVENNSGKRSQYNPNFQRFLGHENRYEEEEENSTENTSKTLDNTACALHCLLENLRMTGESGLPDRYLMTHEVMKDVEDDDLKDFLQESIDDCFMFIERIYEYKNTKDKCDFSKNLLKCLLERGKINCDDWDEIY